MLFIALILAACLYVVLYFVWVAAQGHLSGAAAILQVLNKAILMPENTVFVILRGLIVITLFYLVADFLLSSAKRGLRRKPDDTKPPANRSTHRST